MNLVPRRAACDRAELAELPESDIGDGRRFALQWGHAFRYCPEQGWHRFDGMRWCECQLEHVEAAAKEVAEAIQQECEILSPDASRARERWCQRSCNSYSITGMLRCARTEPPILVDIGAFDKKPFRLNFQNVTLTFAKSGENTRWFHDAEDLITRLAPVRYDPDASSRLWDTHLERVLPDPEVRAYVQRVFGYCAVGVLREQAFFIFHGAGGDGKSTTVNVIRRILGDYAASMPSLLLVDSKFQNGGDVASPQLASLAGDVRLVSVSEPPSRSRLNEGLIKQLTGGAPLRVRKLHKPPFEFTPRFKMILECNSLPQITGVDDGVWRRARVVPWTAQIPGPEMDADMEAKLFGESTGVLNWLLDGVAAYLCMGLAEPRAVLNATAAYRGASSDLRDWFEERVVRDPHAVCDQRALHDDFETWRRENRREGLPQAAFSRALLALGLRSAGKDGRSRRVRIAGARLRSSFATAI